MKRLLILVLVAFGIGLECPAQASLELGIDRSKLGSQSDAVQQKTVQDIRALHATWFRDGPTSGNSTGVANFVNEVRKVKQQNLKMLVNVVQMDEDYDHPLPKNHCGWTAKKLSEIDLKKYTQRLKVLFGALKEAHLSVDAAEFGNEDDTTCYDADVPDGRAATPSDLAIWAHGYGEFLKAGAEVLHDPQYYPQAKIITFGIAHGSDQWDRPPHHISQPARAVAMLRNVKGFNYLDNSTYHVDGYGTHIYAQVDVDKVITERLREDSAALGKGKPLWVTEWGFTDPKAFPNKNGKTMNQALDESLSTYEKISGEIPLGPLMFYRYDVWLVDDSGQHLPLASALSARFARR